MESGGIPPKKRKTTRGTDRDAPRRLVSEKRDEAKKRAADDNDPRGLTKPGADGANGEGGKKTRAPLVDHAYTDFAIVEDNDLRLLDENSSLLPKPASSFEASAREKLRGITCTYGPRSGKVGGVVQPFPAKLFQVLDRSDIVDAIDWMPHGRAFIVKNPKLFTANVLPRFFKQTKFLSFTRQINLWEFKRISRGVDAGAYYHKLFLRGRPYLAMRMRRQKIKGTGMKLTTNPDGEPNFYHDWPAMPPRQEGRVLLPLPPLPSEQRGAMYSSNDHIPKSRQRQAGVSETISNTLPYRVEAGVVTSADAVASFLGQKGAAALPSFGNPIQSIRGVEHPSPHLLPLPSNRQGALQSAPDDQMPSVWQRQAGVSETISNTLAYGAAAGDGAAANAMASFLWQKGTAALPSFGNPIQPIRSLGPPNPYLLPLPATLERQPYPDATLGRYDDLLLAPGVGPRENTLRLRALEQHRAASRGRGNRHTRNALPEGLKPSDPIYNELSTLIGGRGGMTANAAALSAFPYPPSALASNVLLRERLRGLDLERRRSLELERLRSLDTQQINKEQQHMQFFDNLSANRTGSVPFEHLPHSVSAPLVPIPGLGSEALSRRPVMDSVEDALKDAHHLEELALAQRAKARSLALTGALHAHFGTGVPQAPAAMPRELPEQQHTLPTQQHALEQRQEPAAEARRNSLSEDDAVVADRHLSFGRPFGRKY